MIESPYPDASLIINVTIADSVNGIYIAQTSMYGAGSGKVGSQVHINNSLVVGYSRYRRSFGCTSGAEGIQVKDKMPNVTGVWMPFLGDGIGATGGGGCKCCSKKPEPLKSPVGLIKQGEVKLTDVGFASFEGLCSSVTYALRVNHNSLDHNQPSFFRRIAWNEAR